MKKLAMVLALVALGWGTVSAQNNGNGCGNGNGGNGNGNGNGFSNNSNSTQAPALPNALVVRILREAQPVFTAQSGINLGQLIQAYRNGNCTIVLEATNPPVNNAWRVSFGGGMILVIIEDNA